jgi:hypothetical protein
MTSQKVCAGESSSVVQCIIIVCARIVFSESMMMSGTVNWAYTTQCSWCEQTWRRVW